MSHDCCIPNLLRPDGSLRMVCCACIASVPTHNRNKPSRHNGIHVSKGLQSSTGSLYPLGRCQSETVLVSLLYVIDNNVSVSWMRAALPF